MLRLRDERRCGLCSSDHLADWRPLSNPNDPGNEEFQRLPQAQRLAILRDGEAIKRTITSHLLQILIGPPAGANSGTKIDHGSAVAIEVRGRLYAATAWHVVAEYIRRKSAGENVRFQLGNAIVDAEARIAWKNEEADLVFRAITPRQARSTRQSWWPPPRWPPRLPESGDFIAFCGFPDELRSQPSAARVDLGALGCVLQVESASPTRAIAVMQRERLISVASYVPTPGTRMGGMSGGPAFRLDGDSVELVGVVTDFGPEFGTFFIALWGEVDVGTFGASP